MSSRLETVEARGTENKDRLSPEEYYKGLKPVDALRVRLIVGFIATLNIDSPERFAVMAYGSTARIKDRKNANDIDLKIHNNAKDPEARRRAIAWVKPKIRELLAGSGETYAESPQTFRWNGDHIPQNTTAYDFNLNNYHDCGAPQGMPNEDPSFIVFPAQDLFLAEKTLPLHISIAGERRLSTDETIENEKQWSTSVVLSS